jgi:murein peptide amidase A
MSRGVGVLAVGVAAAALAVAISGGEVHAPGRLANGAPHRVAASAAVAPRAILLGRSVGGRAIQATELGDPAAPRKLLVVGVIHGNETAGRQVVHALITAGAPRGVDLWLVDVLNPDGVAAQTRQNARGVDLNRNFPWHWHAAGRRGDQQYPGPRVLSEPESRIAYRLILRLRPRITIWFHQPLRVVDQSGGSVIVERRYARAVGLPLRRLPRYHGSAASWQNTRLRGTTAFVVELPSGRPTPGQAARYRDGVLALARNG